jgi:hypothetical protein
MRSNSKEQSIIFANGSSEKMGHKIQVTFSKPDGARRAILSQNQYN